MIKFLRLFAVLSFGLALASCKYEGTDTGNPQAGIDSPAFLPVVENLKDVVQEGVCAVIADCYGESHQSLCQSSVVTAPKIPQALGYPQEYENLQSLLTTNLSYHRAHLQDCLLAVTALSCTDPLVEASYDPAEGGNFSEIHLLFAASEICEFVNSANSP